MLSEVPTVVGDAWAAEDFAGLPPVVRTVILKAARREYENPEGYSTQGVGEVSATVAITSGVYLTPEEVTHVRRAAGRSPRGGFTGSVRTPSAHETNP